MKEQRQSGLSRAMFCIRLFDLSHQGSPEERYSFLLGALIATDLDALVARGVLRSDRPVTICGHHHFAVAFAECLSQMSIPATVMSVEQTEHAFLAGLRTILTQAPELGDPIPQTKQVGRS
jgi:2-keto-3-deoxy-galactonokinase